MTKISNQYSLTNILTADLANSRLGINNVSPTVALDVTGAATFSSSVTANGNITYYNAGNQNLLITSGAVSNGRMYIYSAGNADIGFQAGGSSWFLNNVGIGTSSPITNLDIQAAISGAYTSSSSQAPLRVYNITNAGGINSSVISFQCSTDGAASNPVARIGVVGESAGSNNGAMVMMTRDGGGVTERMRITSGGNVGIGTSNPGYKLHVSGNGYFSSGLTVEGGVAATSFSATAALVTYNVGQWQITNSYSFTPPNMLSASSNDGELKMYMVWIWGANSAIYGGVRVWMIAVNGGGTGYTVNTLLSRDVGGGSGLDLTRTSATQLTITSNNIAAIKWVSIMQLNTNT